MSNSTSINPSLGNPGTPQAVIPDIYVGLSPSLSTHFITNSIAFPSISDNPALSPSYRLQFNENNPLSPSLSYPQSPSLINIYTPYSDNRSKAKRKLSAREFNDLFSGRSDSSTRLRRSASIIKRKLYYRGTVEEFGHISSSSSSQPCTPLRSVQDILADNELWDLHNLNMTPMRYQYRLTHLRNHRAILLQSPLQNRKSPQVSRNLLKSFNESSQFSYPTLPKASENLGDFSIHTMKAITNSQSYPIRTENSSDSTISTEVESSSSAFEYVGTNGGLNRHHPEVLLDCAGAMISMKELSVDQLLTIKQRMNFKNKGPEESCHFTL